MKEKLKNLTLLGLYLRKKPKIKQEKGDNSTEKIVFTKESHKKVGEYNSLSEIFGERMDFDMSTIKEMVESLEEDSFLF